MEGNPLLLEYIRERFGGGGLKVTPIGKHGRAFVLARRGVPSMVVKAVGSEGKWRRYIWASEFLNSKGIHVPAMAFPPQALYEKNLFLIFEDFVVGEPLSKKELDPATVKEVVRAVKRLHSVEGERWGIPIRKMKKDGFYRHYYRKMRQVSQLDVQIREKLVGSKWVKKLVDKLDSEEKSFQMTHGDLHGNNIVLGDGVLLVDLVRSGFGSYVKDLVRLDVWERRQWGTRRIFDEYTKGLRDESLEEKLKLFYLGEYIRRRHVEWIREELMKLLEKGELS